MSTAEGHKSSDEKTTTAVPVQVGSKEKNAYNEAPMGQEDDPEEADLDDLDDMLDEFSSTKVSTTQEPSHSSQSTKPATAATTTSPHNQQVDHVKESGIPPSSEDATAAEEEFSKQLQEQMAALMGGMDESPEMKREIENMLKELSGGATTSGEEGINNAGLPKGKDITGAAQPPQPSSSSSTSQATAAATNSFRDTVTNVAERLNATETKAGDDVDELYKTLLSGSGLNLGGGAGDGDGDGGDLDQMLLTLMAEMTTKEVLYEPMKGLNDNYPQWLRDNAEKTNPADLERYRRQAKVVSEIVGKFDTKGYSDEDAVARAFVVEKMQEMQEAGNPPPDLVGSFPTMPSADQMGVLDEGCKQQ